QDVVRVQNRVKALYRSRGVAVSGKSVYSEMGRQEWLPKLMNADKPRRTCRLGADDYVQEDRGRTGEICLDTSFHRRTREGSRQRAGALGAVMPGSFTGVEGLSS